MTRLKGYITRRDRDGVWYLMNVIRLDYKYSQWTQVRAEAIHSIGPLQAELLIDAFEAAGFYGVRYTAHVED